MRRAVLWVSMSRYGVFYTEHVGWDYKNEQRKIWGRKKSYISFWYYVCLWAFTHFCPQSLSIFSPKLQGHSEVILYLAQGWTRGKDSCFSSAFLLPGEPCSAYSRERSSPSEDGGEGLPSGVKLQLYITWWYFARLAGSWSSSLAPQKRCFLNVILEMQDLCPLWQLAIS